MVDEIQIHLIPVLLGEGIRLFGQAGGRLALAPIRVIEAPDATHLTRPTSGTAWCAERRGPATIGRCSLTQRGAPP